MEMKLKTRKIISSILVATTIAIPTSGVLAKESKSFDLKPGQKLSEIISNYKVDLKGTSIKLSNNYNEVLNNNISLAKEESQNNKEIKVYFNGEQIEFDQQPIIVDGRTKVPFRAIFETMGTVVYYRDSDSSILGLSRDGDVIQHTVGTNKAIINGVEKTYDSVSEIRNDRTLIPVRMVADLLSAEVEWKEKEQEVEINKEIYTNDYHKKIRGIIGCVLDQNFNPEDFKRYLDYQYNNWDMDPKQVIIDVNMDLDREMVEVDQVVNVPGSHLEAKEEDIGVIQDINDPLMLINRFNKLPDDYEPQNLVLTDYKYSNTFAKIFLEGNVYEAFKKMYDAALNDGIELEIIKGVSVPDFYIGNAYTLQQESYAFNLHPSKGFNELETGLAMHLVSTSSSYNYYLKYAKENNILPLVGNTNETETQSSFDYKYNNFKPQIEKEDRIYEWIENNCYKYGFIVRYPKGKENITKYYYMPWHIRFVGEEVALIINNENLCFEEYCAKYENNSEYKTDLVSTKQKILQKY